MHTPIIYKKPNPSMKVLQSLHGQFSTFQFLIFAWMESKLSAFFISVGTKSQIFGPNILIDSVAQKVVLTLPLTNAEACLKLYFKFRFVRNSPNAFGNISFSTLSISFANNLILRS